MELRKESKPLRERIKGYTGKGYSVVVVVSAMGHTTDELIKLAEEITKKPSRREMDMLLSTGEQGVNCNACDGVARDRCQGDILYRIADQDADRRKLFQRQNRKHRQ